jgi:hypothetical protein
MSEKVIKGGSFFKNNAIKIIFVKRRTIWNLQNQRQSNGQRRTMPMKGRVLEEIEYPSQGAKGLFD